MILNLEEQDIVDYKNILSKPISTDAKQSKALPFESPKKQRISKPKQSDSELIQFFWNSSMSAFFSDEVIAPVAGCSRKTLQCDRWKKSGIPFRKVAGRVLYQKKDVVSYLESHALVTSTSEYKCEVNHA